MFAVNPLGRPVSGVIRPPGSKSHTNRALLLAALARPAVSRLEGSLDAGDTRVMRAALRSLGALIDDNDDPWLVLGTGGDLTPPVGPIDAGASGTTARFVTAAAALAPGEVVIDGTDRMRQRPIGPLVDGLNALGVEATSDAGYPPVRVRGGSLRGGRVGVDASISSQFVSALLMVAPLAAAPVELDLMGPVVSRPYIDETIRMMRLFGADVTVDGDTLGVAPGGYGKAHLAIEADASAAVYPAVAAAITGGAVAIAGIPADSTQPDLMVLDVLEAMACRVGREDDLIRVEGPRQGGLAAVDWDMSGAPDGAMAVAVAALFADGPSRLRGLSTLRVKETDRLDALQTELSRLGAGARITGDQLEIRPGRLHGAEIHTYDDHRMAMALALVGLVVPEVVIADPSVVTKTWPGYFDMIGSL